MKVRFSRSLSIMRMLSLATALMIGLAACHHDSDEVTPTPPGTDPEPSVVDHKTITLSGPGDGKEIIVPASEGMHSLYLSVQLPKDATDKVSSDWIIQNDCDWFKFSNEKKGVLSGSGSKLISFKVGSNTSKERSMTITAIDADDKSNTFQFKVTQKAMDVNSELSDKMAHQSMGYGYRIYMNYASDSSFSSKPILDYDEIMKLETEIGQDIISETYRHNEEIEMVCTNTFTEMSRSLTEKQSEGASCWGTREEISNFITKTKRVDQTCSYIRLKEVASSRTVDMGMITALDPTRVFTQDFRTALGKITNNTNLEDPDVLSLVATYGTHFCVSADLGGYIAIKTIVDRDTLFTKEEITRTIIKKRLWFSVSSETKDKEIKEDYIASLHPESRVEVHGGNEDIGGVIQKTLEDGGQIGDLSFWQSSMRDNKGNLQDLAVVSVRTIPIYDLISNPFVRKHVRDVILEMLKKDHIDCPKMEEDQGYDCFSFDISGALDANNYLAVGMTKVGDVETSRVLIVREYVPSIRKDQLVEVAYPMVNNRPYLTRGIFIGDKEHQPGIVRWYSDGSTFEPDTISRTDKNYAKLFDSEGKLKQVYYYFHDIHILALDDLSEVKTDKISYTPATTFVKVGTYYWTRNEDEKTTEDNVKLYNLPTQSEVQNLCSIVPYSMIEKKQIGLNWSTGFERGDMSNGKPVTNENIYLPIRYFDGDKWELRVTRLSPSGSVPLYYPATLCPASTTEGSMLLTPVHCSTTFKIQ